MQFQVPQFIETEDKLLGPFTLRQFAYVGAAGGIIFILYFMLRTGVWLGITLVLSAISLTLALGRVNGRAMSVLVTSAFFFYWKPQTYLWQPDTPGLQKDEALRRSGFSLENLVQGLALKDAWQTLQTGSKGFADKGKMTMSQLEEKYEIVRKLAGDQQAAKRIDYR